MKLATIICYCSSDERFARACLKEASKVSNEIIIPIGSHLFNGVPEKIDTIESLKKEFNLIKFAYFDWEDKYSPRYWHNISRITASDLISKDIDWVLFLDIDEILDVELFNKFLSKWDFENYDSYKLACAWYFREPVYKAKNLEDSIVLVRKNLINIDPHNEYAEREQMHEMLNVPKKRMVTVNNKPIVHHFSWVRTQKEMLYKVNNWGHKSDKDWTSLVNEEFSRPFNGKCFVNDYEFETVKDQFNLGI
tara:strand:+ start:550 stop:1299 length:750 start_codon:yes stop_codon:yes gene_type:complete